MTKPNTQRSTATNPKINSIHTMHMSFNTKVRLAGILYLLIAVCGGFAFFAGYEAVLVPNDPTATALAIQDNEFVFRMGIVGDALLVIAELILTLLLFQIFKPINTTLSAIAAVARFAMTGLIAANILNKLIVLYLLTNATHLLAFNADQLNTLAMLFLTSYGLGSLIWSVLFGLHLCLIGYLILRSNILPFVLGWLLLLASSAYFIDSFGRFIAPEYGEIYSVIILLSVPAELSLAFWLLIKGIPIALYPRGHIID